MSLMLDDEVMLGNDSRYKNFIVAIEKALKHFESSVEWADLITNLVKVKKTIEQYSQFKSIPKRITLSKRLAQCLHPALPAGVHLKTIEVYETIFRIIDKNNLQRDLILYSYGLFSLLSVAALPVKPTLLALYETYFLPLGEALNPVLTGFLIGLFSALEEGADYYDRVIRLLNNLAERIDEFYFYDCIWSAIHSIATVRFSAIIFILNHFDKRKNMNDQIYLIGLSAETMVSAICTCLYDSRQALVQRSILDFLLTCLPMHKKQLTEKHMIKLIAGTLRILLQRDMPLSRRIYTWFFGANQLDGDNTRNDEHYQVNGSIDSSPYFLTYTRELLVASLKNLLEIISLQPILMVAKTDGTVSKVPKNTMDSLPSFTWTLTKLIRVLLILIDKSDIGPNIIEYIFINYTLVVYEQVYRPNKQLKSTTNQYDDHYSDAWKTFNVLIDTLEPYFIWEYLTKHFDISINPQHFDSFPSARPSLNQICGVIDMLLDIFSLENSLGTQSTHLFEMLCHLIQIMNDNIEKFTSNQITVSLELLLKLFKSTVSTNAYPHLSIFRRSSTNLDKMFDDDCDTEDDNEYSIDIYNKLLCSNNISCVENLNLMVQQEQLDVIQKLLNQMVCKIEKQLDKLDNRLTSKHQSRLSTNTMSESMNYIEKTIELYKQFFHRFIITHIIDQNQGLINDKFQSIYSVIQHKTNGNLSSYFNRCRQLNEFQFQLKLNDNVDQYVTAFEDCCRLLTEFSCYPTESSLNDKSFLSKGKIKFEDWAMDLYILSLCVNDHFSLRTIAVSVLIELFGYRLSLSASTNISTSIDTTENSLLTVASFTQEQILALLNETDFFQYIISYFWEYLNDKYGREYNLKASHLLSILHSMLPTDLCEDLIYNQLSLIKSSQTELDANGIDEYKHFFKLWNSTRDIPHLKNEPITKSFQRCLIFVLRTLKESKNYELRSIVQQWTYDCFIHGDMCRIFDTLLIMLLDSDTARVSMQRFDSIIHNKELFLNQKLNTNDQILINSNKNNDNSEISPSVVFDDENYEDEYMYDDDAYVEETHKDKRIRTISSINSSESVNHAKSSPQNIKFPIITSLSQPILSNILSFSPPALLKSVKQRAPTMPNIFNRNNTLSESNNNIPQIDTSNTIMNHSFQSHSMSNSNLMSEYNASQFDDSKNFPYAYILLYTQTYDHDRVMLSLDIIDSLFDLLMQQLTQALLISSNLQSSPISIHNKQMHELFFKHCRSIEGKEFGLTNQNNQECQSYLYLFLNILLIYTYSYYPKGYDIEKNRLIHVRSLMLLTHVCHDLSCLCMDNKVLINYIMNLFEKLSFQKIVLTLFNRFIDKDSNLSKTKLMNDFKNESLNGQLTKDYLKKLIRLFEEIILLENIFHSTNSNLNDQLTVNQTVFLSTILQCLKQIDCMEIHPYIICFVVKILPHCGSALKTTSIRVIEQLCQNLNFVAECYSQQETTITFKRSSSFDPIDYIICLIERISYICNYCLGSTVNSTQHFTETLCPQHWIEKIKNNSNDSSDVRQSMLHKLPLVLFSILRIWKTVLMSRTYSIWPLNNTKVIREKIIQFISSLTKSNGVAFIRAILLCWGECKQQQQQQKFLTIQTNNVNEMEALVDILMNINNYAINDIIYNMNTLIRYLSKTNHKKKQNYVIWCLQLLLAYFEYQNTVGFDCWPVLTIMFKECLSQTMSSSVTFLMIRILNYYLKQSLFLIDKKDLNDLGDTIMKVLDNCTTIVGLSLEQTNWLRKNLQVRMTQTDPGTQPTTIDSSYEIDRTPSIEKSLLDFDENSPSITSSFMALTILSEYSAKLLDIVYHITDEKDRIIGTYLQNLVNNVMPYVRIHVASSAPSYRSASTLLMNISQYSYTRKTWRKEVFEQLFDIGFFQVDLSALTSWKIIINNMITDEKSISFRDIMNKINTVQTGLLVSKEQEYEQRAMLIKRFAFVIYASDKDLCNQYLPEILEFIIDLLKLPQIPILYTQLYLFFRVLLLRISNKNLISFWPIFIAELVQILLQIEQDLSFNIEGDVKSNVQQMTTNDLTLTNISNGSSDTNPSLKMYLYACKLLDILLIMSYSGLYHFQLFRSAFVADHDTDNSDSNLDIFIAFSIRLFKLFERKLTSTTTPLHDHLPIIDSNSNPPLLRLRTISTIIELFPFFKFLGRIHLNENLYVRNDQVLSPDTINDIETSVLEDFVESWT
ncbi:unnamed protein product [Rotaria socialis]